MFKRRPSALCKKQEMHHVRRGLKNLLHGDCESKKSKSPAKTWIQVSRQFPEKNATCKEIYSFITQNLFSLFFATFSLTGISFTHQITHFTSSPVSGFLLSCFFIALAKSLHWVSPSSISSVSVYFHFFFQFLLYVFSSSCSINLYSCVVQLHNSPPCSVPVSQLEVFVSFILHSCVVVVVVVASVCLHPLHLRKYLSTCVWVSVFCLRDRNRFMCRVNIWRSWKIKLYESTRSVLHLWRKKSFCDRFSSEDDHGVCEWVPFCR